MNPRKQEVVLPAPVAGRVDVLVVAAEHSGDEHAARMVRELRGRHPSLAIAALGGPKLAAAGAQLLRDLTGSSSIGFAVIGKLFFYRALITEIVRWVGEHRPRVVCFVDSSGLNLRIARGLFERGFSAKAGGPTRAVYYISPQIWASRARRRFEMAKHLDGLAAIFPFEPAVYADTTLPVEFVGHPFVASDHVPPVRYDPAGPVLLLPGSRKGAVARIFPVLLAAFRAFGQREAVVLYPSVEILDLLRATTPPPNVRLVQMADGGTGGQAVAASAVLTSSGTMSMQCALAGIPGAVTYRTDSLTYLLGRLLVKVEYLGIANLLLREPMYPEYIQNVATPAALAAELRACVQDPGRRERTAGQAARLRALLSVPASGTAAGWLERQLGSSSA
ncbi:MAG: lipid-A-disaccharide synthase [Opitutus sp.]|nr:lipid-A-disaccharide synthase [Opitutus sp.]